MTITKVSIQQEQLAIVLCCGEAQPPDTQVVIGGAKVPIQAIYDADTGFQAQPGDVHQFSMAFSWMGIDGWALGDAFSLVNSVETHVVSDYASGFDAAAPVIASETSETSETLEPSGNLENTIAS